MDRPIAGRPRTATTRPLAPNSGLVAFFNRPAVVLAVDDSVPATHRSRRNRTAHPPQVPEERMGIFPSTAFAIVSLVFVSVVALGSLLASTAILRLASPNRRFDAFRALHEPLVIGVLFGLGVIWLLPPHPWQVKPAQPEPKKRRLFQRRRRPDGALRPTGVAVLAVGADPPRLVAAGGIGNGPWHQEQHRCCGSGRRGIPAPSGRINGERNCSPAVPENRRSSVPWATC